MLGSYLIVVAFIAIIVSLLFYYSIYKTFAMVPINCCSKPRWIVWLPLIAVMLSQLIIAMLSPQSTAATTSETTVSYLRAMPNISLLTANISAVVIAFLMWWVMASIVPNALQAALSSNPEAVRKARLLRALAIIIVVGSLLLHVSQLKFLDTIDSSGLSKHDTALEVQGAVAAALQLLLLIAFAIYWRTIVIIRRYFKP